MSKHVMCSCGEKFHNGYEWAEHYRVGQPLARVAMDTYRDAHHIVKRRLKKEAAQIKHGIVRNTECTTMRQVSMFLAEYGICMKHGMLWRMVTGARVTGYVEKLQSGKFTICMHL